MKSTDPTAEQRERLTDQVLAARSLAEIAAARAALEAWMDAHPDDAGMEYGFRRLFMMEESRKHLDAEAEAARAA